MKPRHLITLLLLFCFACEKEKDNLFQHDTDERFSIIKEEITTMSEVTIGFYWEPKIKGPLTELPVTTCLTTEVKFEHPYIIANGFKFHAYYWARTENQIASTIPPKVVSMRIAFDKEK